MAAHSGECANCGSPATLRCARCTEGLNMQSEPSPVFCCSKDCQKARIANDRKQLYRGAEMTKELFYAFREVTFDYEPTSIEVKDGVIHMVKPEFGDTVTVGPFFPFPEHLVSDPNDKKAVLTWRTCNEALKFFYELLKKVLTGIPKTGSPPEEACVFVRPSHNAIIRYTEHGEYDLMLERHVVLLVTLKNDEQHVIDLTGAQHRQHRAVMPWNEYSNPLYAEDTSYREPFGSNLVRWKSACGNEEGPGFRAGHDFRYMKEQFGLIKGVNGDIETWEKVSGMTVPEMIGQEESAFKRDRGIFLQTLVGEMAEIAIEFMSSMEKSRAEDFASLKTKIESGAEEIPQEVKDLVDQYYRLRV